MERFLSRLRGGIFRHCLILLLPCILLAACDGSDELIIEPPTREFVPEGLAGRAINGLFQVGERLLATTDAGIYGKGIDQNNWQLVGLQDHLIVDLVIVDELAWIAAVAKSGLNPAVEPELLTSVNRGSNWGVVDSDFGGSEDSMEPIYALHYDQVSEVLYATGSLSLAVSKDLGQNWNLLEGSWDAFATGQDALNLNTQRGEIWYGGQNALEQMTLRRVDLPDGSGRGFGRLLPSPAVIKNIEFHAQDAELVFASGEGGILRSEDNGASWTQPLGDVDHRFYYEVVSDPQAPDILFTAGWDKGAADGPQPLILEVSENAGESFEAFEYEDSQLQGGALSLLAVEEENETVLYIGLDGGGIVKVLNPARPLGQG